MLDLVNGTSIKHEKKVDDIEFFNLDPQDNYVGVENIVPLLINGKEVYLEQNELHCKSIYSSSDNVKVVYANDKLIAMYDDALLHSEHRKGILILDCSCPRVNACNNITGKATAVQEMYKRKGKDVTVITFCGRGISIKVPNKKWDHERWKKLLIGDALKFIDEQYGLEMPVIIFGYTKMRRGVSFRSADRVPTHMVLSLGRGHSISNVVQTLGRATFNGQNLLIENGFDNVTVLMTSNDLTMCRKIQNYVNHVACRIPQGDSFAEAVKGTIQKVPECANFIRHTCRELGRIRGNLSRLFFFNPSNAVSHHHCCCCIQKNQVVVNSL
jgi:hypothetical protein